MDKIKNQIIEITSKPYFWSVILLLGFGIIYANSLTFVYVEGDDATTILHHILGRDPVLWPRYAAYHSMMDALLSLFPSSEPLLRCMSILLSALAAIFFLYFTLFLVFDWLRIDNTSQRNAIAIISLLAFPEIFFLGLIYNPSLIGMAFILAAHHMVRSILKNQPCLWSSSGLIKFFVSAFLFGFGVSFRWNLVTYGLVIFADLILTNYFSHKESDKRIFNSLVISVTWGILALLGTITFLSANGYGSRIISTFVNTGAYLSEISSFSLYSLLAMTPLLTPIVLILSFVGLWQLIKNKQYHLLTLFAVAIVISLPSDEYVPKKLSPFIPLLILSCVSGFLCILNHKFKHEIVQKAICLFFIIVLLVPWVFGIKVFSNDTLWGPGFEIRTIDSNQVENIESTSTQLFGIRLPIPKIEFVFNDGLAFPTSEGIRSLGGFGKTLLGGGWRNFVTERDLEIQEIVALSVNTGEPILSDERPALLIAKILDNGYTINDAPPYWGFSGSIFEYTFESDEQGILNLYFQRERSLLFDPTHVSNLLETIGKSEPLMYAEYPSTLSKLSDISPGSVKPFGPFTALVNLREILDNLR